jgi:hypothetical protein
MRKHPRFVTHDRVLVRVDGREDLRVMWMSDISKGGLFARTDEPPPLRSRVEVAIETPDGNLTLQAEVVHVLDVATAKAYGRDAGVGLQLTGLDAIRRAALERYVEGLSAQPAPDPTAAGPVVDDGALLRTVQDFLKGFEEEDLYRATGLGPLSSAREVSTRLSRLQALFEAPADGLKPAQQLRVERARALLRKVAALLTDPARRLDHDFRHGHVLAEERIAAASGPGELEALRVAWHRAFDWKLAEAEKHAGTALKFEQVLDFDKAINAGRASLNFDPFNVDLRHALEVWQRRADQARSLRRS